MKTISDETLAELLEWFDDDTPEGPTVKGAQVTAVIRELIAERLKRRQAEHERDSILETLANVGAERDALMKYAGHIPPCIFNEAYPEEQDCTCGLSALRAQLAAQEKP